MVKMITYSIIKKSQLEGALRIDAEYYQPEYLYIINHLNKLHFPVKKLKDLIASPVVTGTTPKERVCKDDDSDIKFIKTDVLRDGEINFDSADCLPKNQNRKSSQPKTGDVLTTIIGADYPIVGRSALIYSDNPIMNINQNIVRIRPNESLLSEYLISFVRSRFGLLQLWQQSRQTEQVNLNCREVENILIPIFPMALQKFFVQLVIDAKKEKDLSISYYLEAEELLLKELGLKSAVFEDQLSYVVNLSDGKDTDRIDAEYFQPKYAEIIKKIKTRKDGWDILEDLTSLIGHPSNPPYVNNSSENKTFIITQKHLANYFPADKFWEDTKALYTTDEFIKNNARYLLKENDIILYSVGAYIGKANIYNSSIKATIGSFLTLIRPKQEFINPFCLLVFLNSSIGRLLTRRNSRGLAQQYIYPYDTKTIPIPKLDHSIQQEIEKLIKKGQEAKKKSKELLEEAKRKVEEIIEKSAK